jgi:pyrroline-5-carboxylate reductase
MILGFVGTGHIAAAMVTGLCTAPQRGDRPQRILVSPRNAETAAGLAKRFTQVAVARDNQAVVDGSDWVVLAVRPQVAREVVAALKFKPGQTILSLIAPVADDWIGEAVKPGRFAARIFVMPPCETHVGPVMVFPREPAVEALMRPLGTVIPVKDRREFLALWTLTALIAPFYGFAAKSGDWAAANGAGAAEARAFAASMLHSLAAVAAAPGAEPPDALAKHAQTPGGLNEQVVRELAAKGWFDAVGVSLDGILKRLEGRK